MSTNVFTGHYRPAFAAGQTLVFKCSVTAAAQRLTDLLGVGIPMHIDRATDLSPKTALVPYRHVVFQSDPTNTGNIYYTADNNTTPVVLGPGLVLVPGQSVKFEMADELLRARTTGDYLVDAKSAFQFIASVNPSILLVHFFD